MSYSHNNSSDLIDLGIYLKSIKDICKVISSEEESELVRRMQLGDETARERLIKANLGFVVHVAKEYAGYGLTHMELISEGNMGLIEATYRFDEKKGIDLLVMLSGG